MNFRSDSEVKKPMSIFAAAGLTDIVLLLLIFFLLTSSFVTNFGIKVNIPQAETATITDQHYINVTITSDGEFYIMGTEVSRNNLAPSIREEHQMFPNATLVVRADKNAIMDDAVYVMNIGKALDINMMIATERGSR
ncbi:biopolymer transporter ExbD [Balneolaceae bacterium ANBcel3]|nr:biopolymer transporter ExbD [Balneolaceae bacterium ANBcel3]